MKVLLTGATSAQVSSKKHEVVPTFSGLVNRALTQGKHDVTWLEPSVSLSKDYLAEFDSVVVGLAPPTSTAAHRIYGALSVIQYAHELGTLRLMLDAPEPRRVWAGIRAIYNKPEDLTKEFYSKRREFRKTSDEETLARLHQGISTLYKEEWPKTIFPSFPWMGFPSVSSEIPMTNGQNLVGINYDAELLSQESSEPYSLESPDYWVVDAANTSWTKRVEQTVSNRVEPVKLSRWEANSAAIERMSNSIGCLVSLYSKDSPWWSISLSQALHCGIPVATDWRLSHMLGSPWTVLPHAIEEMSSTERYDLSKLQKESYLEAIPTWSSSVELACNTLLKR